MKISSSIGHPPKIPLDVDGLVEWWVYRKLADTAVNYGQEIVNAWWDDNEN